MSWEIHIIYTILYTSFHFHKYRFHFASAFPFGLDLAAINIQRGRDHGLPAYTQWREPCGLSPIVDWDDLERVVGPQSVQRIRKGYRNVDDIDLFVGGLAERPVVGGLVGPVFACIIAQQFSNLRKGDRFWYENGGFESSFTPAQLQSVRQVSFAQVVCRTIGGGTLQPHIFLPHTVSTNERLLCNTGSLTPIDLKPWTERDPFTKDLQKTGLSTKNSSSEENSDSIDDSDVRGAKFPVIIPIKQTVRHQQQHVASPVMLNAAFVDNKIDLKRPHNRIDDKINMPIRKPPARPVSKHKPARKTTHKPGSVLKSTTTTRPTRRTVTKSKHKLRKHKRDVTQNDKARGAIYIKIDRPASDKHKTKNTPFSSKHPNEQYKPNKSTTDKEYIILTPDQSSYDIEIKIKPNDKRTQPNTGQKIVAAHQLTNGYFGSFDDDGGGTTKRPLHFYNVPQPALADHNSYGSGVDGDIDNRPQHVFNDATTSRPDFHGIITKKTTIAYGASFDDDVTVRPYFPSKRPTHNYGSAHDDNDNKPFYAYPTVQQADQSSYYNAQGDLTHEQDDYVTSIIQNGNTLKPYHSVPLYQTNNANRPNKRPTFNDDLPQRPSYSYRPPQADSGYANRPLSDTNYDSGPVYLDDFPTTQMPIRLTTTYSYASTIKLQRPKPNMGYYGPTTNRPHDLMTFYTVMTTKKKKTTRPTRPMTYNQQDEDDDDDDDDDSDGTTWNPTAVISNIVNTFSDYFGSSATTSTRKPYIQNDDDDDDDEENFYMFPSFQQQSFPYSRQKDGPTLDTNTNRIPSSIQTQTISSAKTSTSDSSLNRRIDTEADPDNETTNDNTEDYNSNRNTTGEIRSFGKEGRSELEHMRYGRLEEHKQNHLKSTDNNMTDTVQRDTKFKGSSEIKMTSSIHANAPTGVAIGFAPLNVLTKPERYLIKIKSFYVKEN